MFCNASKYFFANATHYHLRLLEGQPFLEIGAVVVIYGADLYKSLMEHIHPTGRIAGLDCGQVRATGGGLGSRLKKLRVAGRIGRNASSRADTKAYNALNREGQP